MILSSSTTERKEKQATMNIETDQAFLSLLSSQRELLNRLNMEASEASKITQDSKQRKDSSSGANHNRSINSHTNHSIAERRSSLDIVASRRFSIGFGCDHDAFTMGDTKAGLLPKTWKEEGLDFTGTTKRFKIDAFSDEGMKPRKKRRLSSLSFLNLDLFDTDELQFGQKILGHDENEPSQVDITDVRKVETMVVNPPIMEVSKSSSKATQENVDEKKGEEASDDEDEESVAGESRAELAAADFKPIQVDPAKMRDTMKSFHKSMEMSQFSQQAIHDWDRKMGLKRSHSKTMRLSTRSRKKLKAIMKKEIALMMKVKC